MRTVLENRQRIGNEQRAHPAGLLIGIDDRYRQALFQFADRVVGVGQAERQLASADARATCLLPVMIWTFALSRLKNAFARSSPQTANRQAACVAVVPNSGLAMPTRSFHWGAPDRRSTSAVGLAHQFRVDDQHARPGREPVPRAAGERSMAGYSSASGGCRLQQARAPPAAACAGFRCSRTRRTAGVALGHDRFGQPDGLGRLGIEFGQRLDTGFAVNSCRIGCENSESSAV